MPQEKMKKLSDGMAISIVPGIEVLLWDTRGYSRRFVTALDWAEALKLRDLINEQEAKDADG